MLVSRSCHRYESVKHEQEALTRRIRELAQSRPRWGYRRLTILLRREGWQVNHKRVYRLYRDEGLQVRVKRRRKLDSLARGPMPAPKRRNERWAIDFVADHLVGGGKIRTLTAIDIFSRECVGINVAYSMRSERVTNALNRFIQQRGSAPGALTLDNGTEFRAHHFDEWAYLRGIALDFIRPGKPVENAFIESFNGALRENCLNVHWFEDLQQARQLIESWRLDYNEVRPHSSLGDVPPAAYRPPVARRRLPKPVDQYNSREASRSTLDLRRGASQERPESKKLVVLSRGMPHTYSIPGAAANLPERAIEAQQALIKFLF